MVLDGINAQDFNIDQATLAYVPTIIQEAV